MPISVLLNNTNVESLLILHQHIDPKQSIEEFFTNIVNLFCQQYFAKFAQAVQDQILICENCKIRYTMNFQTVFQYCPKCSHKLKKVYSNEAAN